MIEHDVVQGSDDWFELRLGKATASEFGRIIQPNPVYLPVLDTNGLKIVLGPDGERLAKKGAVVGSTDGWKQTVNRAKGEKLQTQKVWRYSKGAERYIHQLITEERHAADGRYPARVETYTSRSMEWGAQLEAEARFAYVKETGLTVRRVGFCETDDHRFGCSPDGGIDKAGLRFEGGLELKCPDPKSGNHLRWHGRKVCPPEHLAQVHGGLIVTGAKWWDFMSYCHGLPIFIVRVYPDEFTEQLRKYLDRFWTEYQEVKASLGPVA